MNRRRVATIAAVALFVAAVVGVALVAAGGDGSKTRATPALAKLPSGAVADAAVGGSMGLAQPIFPVEYVVKGTLPALPTTAPAYAVTGSATEADAARLAGAIGLTGRPVDSGGAFVVADGDRRLVVPERASDGWLYSDQPGNAECPATSNCAVSSSGVAVAPAGCPSPPPCPAGRLCAASSCPGGSAVVPPRPADVPTKEAAEQVGKTFLAKVGVDVGHAKIETNDLFSAWSVSADPEVGGLPVLGFSASVTVGPKGVVTNASGHLGRLDKAGEYPLAGTDVGLTRLRAGMVGFFGGPRPLTAVGSGSAGLSATAAGGSSTVAEPVPPAATGTGDSGPPPGDPSKPQPGSAAGAPAQPNSGTSSATPGAPPLACPPPADGACSSPPQGPAEPPVTVSPDTVAPDAVPPRAQTVTITGVHLALAFVPVFEPGKSAMLEPVYVFETDATTNLPPVPAVTDSLLEQATPPDPGPCQKPPGLPAHMPPGQAAPDLCVQKGAPTEPAATPNP